MVLDNMKVSSKKKKKKNSTNSDCICAVVRTVAKTDRISGACCGITVLTWSKDEFCRYNLSSYLIATIPALNHNIIVVPSIGKTN